MRSCVVLSLVYFFTWLNAWSLEIPRYHFPERYCADRLSFEGKPWINSEHFVFHDRVYFAGHAYDQIKDFLADKAKGMVQDVVEEKCQRPDFSQLKFEDECFRRLSPEVYEYHKLYSLPVASCTNGKKKKDSQKIADNIRKGTIKQVENIKEEFLSCSSGKGKSCFRSALHFFSRRSELERSFIYLQKGCQLGDLASCRWNLLFDEVKERIAGLEKRCWNNKDFVACEWLTYHLIEINKFQEARNVAGSACRLGGAEGCFLNGLLFWKVGNRGQAYSIMKQACSMGSGRSCTTLGKIHEKYSDQDRLEKYEEGCLLQSGLGCLKAHSINRKISSLEAGCQFHSAKSCQLMAQFFFDQRDMMKAMDYSRKACHQGLTSSCTFAGNLMRRSGAVIEARKYLEKACNLLDDNACFELGVLYHNHYATSHLSSLFLQRSCARKHRPSCRQLGIYQNEVGNFTLAREVLLGSCVQGHSDSCLSLGLALNEKNDDEESRSIWTRSCVQGSALACFHLGQYWDRKQVLESAMKFYDRSCYLGHVGGCLLSGYSSLKMKDFDRSLSSLQIACDEEYSLGCALLGDIYHELGNVGERKKYKKKACSLGFDLQC